MQGRSFLRAAWAAACLLLAGSAALAGEAEGGLWHLSPENIGTYAHDVDHLYRVILGIVTFTFVLTEGLLVFFVLKYRAKPGGRATYTHGNPKLEVIWTVVPGAVLFWLALYQIGTWKDVKVVKPDPKEGLVVQVMARQFEWHFRYAGPDGVFGTDDDLLSLGTLHVPVDTKVTVQLRTQDVLHSFFLPYLRLKQDTVPGRTITQWFEATKTTEAARKERGDEAFQYEIACAELCGLGHTRMRGFLHVHSKEDFFEWADKQYVEEVLEYGQPYGNPIVDTWPRKDAAGKDLKVEDVWMRENWPADLKAKWPKAEDEGK